MPERSPSTLPAAALIAEFQAGRLTPSDVLEATLERIEGHNDELHAYVTVTAELARAQAAEATAAYQRGEHAPLLGVPVSVKDAFHVQGVETTLGSLLHKGHIAKTDSGVVRRLRAAGAVFTGKTNTAEFGQSATTDNMLGPDTGNPWDPSRTPGGSSGGAAASVAAGLANIAVGSDGGGSVRIPASFTGLVGIKATPGVCRDEYGFRAMTEFVSPGPLAWRVADARLMLGVLADRDYTRAAPPRRLRIGYCARPEGRPVDAGVAMGVSAAAVALADLGHDVTEVDLPIQGWNAVFGPLVLEDEHRERGHLLATADRLSGYERASLIAARSLDPAEVTRAREELPRYRAAVAGIFEHYDVLLTPTVAVPAFPLGERPKVIDGQRVSSLWGAFPFAAPFNVAGTAALSLPCGLSHGLPVGAQLVTAANTEQLLLDVSEELEAALGFDPDPVLRRWADPATVPATVP